MALYRFRCIDRRNRTVWQRDMDCADDLHALDMGNDLDCAADVEITLGGRRVARIPKGGDSLFATRVTSDALSVRSRFKSSS